MANNKKKCEICGTEYKYCANCGEFDNYPRWMFLFHSENCRDIWSVINAYRAKQKTAYEAKKELEQLDITNVVPVYQKYIDEIFENAVEPEPTPKPEKKVYNNSESNKYSSKKSYKK